MIAAFLDKLKLFMNKGGYLSLPAVCLFGYILLRAQTLSLTWDEANTFFEYVRNPRWLPHDFNYMSANNHLLNTWLMKCSVGCFGESELALRLPNVLAGAVYFYAAARIAVRLFERQWQVYLAFFLLTLNPFVLDFFSVARGYGLSLAFMLCAFYQLTKYILDGPSLRKGMYAQVFLVLATLANLTLVYLLPAVTFLLLLDLFIFYRPVRLKHTAFLLTLIPVLTIVLLLPYQQKLREAGAFFFGQEIQSAGDTFVSLAQSSLYEGTKAGWSTLVLTVFFSVIPLISVIYCMRNTLLVLRSAQGKWLLFITLTLFFAITGPIVQHWLFKTNFLAGRTALFYLPLVALNFLGLLAVSKKLVRNSLLVFSGLVALMHFGITVNTYGFYDWREQAHVKEAMLELKKENRLLNDSIYANVMATDLPFEKQINYYRMRYDLKKISHAARQENAPDCSYYFAPFPRPDSSGKIKTLSLWRNSPYALFYYPERRPLKYVTEVWQDFEHEDPLPALKTDKVYIGHKGTFAGNGREYSIDVPIDIPDSLSSRNCLLTLNCRLYYYTRNTSALLVFAFDGGSAESWEAMHITELPEKPGEWSITGWTRPVPAGTKKARVYLWNRDKTLVLMDNVSLRLLTYPR